MRLRVNPIACDGHGLCAELLPELIRLDDWGYPIVERSPVPVDLLDLAHRAVGTCPTLALLLEADRSGEIDQPAESDRPRRANRPARP